MLSQLSYGPIKTGLLSIKHPIGSEFHIITHNGSLHLTTIGFIIVATLGVFLLPPIVVYLINPIGLHYLISIGYISVSLPLTGLTAVISLIEIKLFDLYYPCLRNSTYPRSALRSQTTHLFLNYYWRFSEHLFVWSRIGTSCESRTHNTLSLNQVSLPIGLKRHMRQKPLIICALIGNSYTK